MPFYNFWFDFWVSFWRPKPHTAIILQFKRRGK